MTKEQQDILTVLRQNTNSQWHKPKWGIFIDGKQAYVSGKNVYASDGIAKKKVLDYTFGRYSNRDKKKYAERKASLEELIKEGIIEIKQL